jgi:hypothetical protein
VTQQRSITILEVRQDGANAYYRVFVNGVEKPSLVFVREPDRTVHGDVALQQWWEQNLNKLESGKVVEANVSART